MEYTNIYSGRRGAASDPEMTSMLQSECAERDVHVQFPSTDLYSQRRDFNNPITLTCSREELDVELYVNVYGVRDAFYLTITRPDNIHYGETRAKLLTTLRTKLPSVSDLKLVYKRPYEGACMGERLFLKVYHNGSASAYTLRNGLSDLKKDGKLTNIDVDYMHDSSLTRTTKWTSAHLIAPLGRVRVNGDVHGVVQTKKTITLSVHHDDVEFDVGYDNERRNPFATEELISPSEVWNRVHFECMARLTKDGDVADILASNLVLVNMLAKGAARARGLFAKANKKGDKPTWTWKKMKTYFLHAVFGMVTRGHRKQLVIDSVVKRDGGFALDENDTVGGITLSGGTIGEVSLAMLKVACNYRRALAVVWLDLFVTKEIVELGDKTKQDTMVDIGKRQRWLATDIETSHKPHEIIDEQITAISMILFDRNGNGKALAAEQLIALPPGKTSEDGVECEERVREMLSELYERSKLKSLPSIASMAKVLFFETELKMLDYFFDFSRRNRISFVTTYNGHKFDIPFVNHRYAVCKARSEKAQLALVHAPYDIDRRPRSMKLCFSNREDSIAVKYDPPSKRVHHLQYGKETYRKRISERINRLPAGRRGGDGEKFDYDGDTVVAESGEEEDESGDEDRYDVNVNLVRARVAGEVEVNAPKPVMAFMRHSRKIAGMLMGNVGMVDVMNFVSDGGRIKLDTAAKNILGFGKVEHESVSYANLCQTWKEAKHWPELAFYNLMDSILVMELVLAKRLGDLYLGVAAISGISARESFMCEGLRNLVGQIHRFGRKQNILTPDSTKTRDDRYLWVPGVKFNSEKDYKNLRPPAGTTVGGVSGVYVCPSHTVDFEAFYSTIMRGYNYCATTMLTPEFVEENGHRLSRGEDFKRVHLENAAPRITVSHTCHDPSTCLCDGHTKCSFKEEEIHVVHDVYFATSKIFPSVLHNICATFDLERKECKAKRDLAKDTKDWIAADAYEIMQLSYKLCGNTCYGASMRFNSVVGDAITSEARKQIRILADKGQKECKGNGCIVNGDTDSIFYTPFSKPEQCKDLAAMAKHMGMGEESRAYTMPEVVKTFMNQAERFCEESNTGKEGEHGRLFDDSDPHYVRIAYEKSFISGIRNLAKKHYVGDKIEPGMKWTTHKAGMVGKKADTTFIKTGVQFGADRLLHKRDIEGLIAFFDDVLDLLYPKVKLLYDAMNEAIALGQDIEENDMNGRRAAEVRARIRTIQDSYDDLSAPFPKEWFLSKEKVNSVYKVAGGPPLSKAARQAILDCKMRGESVDHAPSAVMLCRGPDVQMGGLMLKSLGMVMSNPPRAGSNYEKRRLARLESSIGTVKYKACVRQEELRLARARKKKDKFTKLTITGMPANYCVGDNMKMQMSDKQRMGLEGLRNRLNNMGDDKSRVTKEDEASSRARIERLKACLHPSGTDPFPTLCLFENFALTELHELVHVEHDVYRLPNIGSSANLARLGEGYRSVEVSWNTAENTTQLKMNRSKGDATMSTATFGPHRWSYEKENVIQLNAGDRGGTRVLDMDSYRDQTSATPYVVPSFDGKMSFLVNEDSYLYTEGDAFSFSVRSHDVLKTMAEMGKFVDIAPVKGTSRVMFTKGSTRIQVPVTILRSDGKSTAKWTGAESCVANCVPANIEHGFNQCRKFDHTLHTDHVVHFTHLRHSGVVVLSNDLGLNRIEMNARDGLGCFVRGAPVRPVAVQLKQATSTKRKTNTNSTKKANKKLKTMPGTTSIKSFFKINT